MYPKEAVYLSYKQSSHVYINFHFEMQETDGTIEFSQGLGRTCHVKNFQNSIHPMAF